MASSCFRMVFYFVCDIVSWVLSSYNECVVRLPRLPQERPTSAPASPCSHAQGPWRQDFWTKGKWSNERKSYLATSSFMIILFINVKKEYIYCLKYEISFFDHFPVVKWYRQVQQNGVPDLLCQFPSDVLVNLPHNLWCYCGWPCLSQIKLLSKRFCDN